MSAGNTAIWMPVYIANYIADTIRLTTEQHGAYLLLLFELWRTGTLPDDDEELALITRLPPEAWSRQRKKLARYFIIADGCWTNSDLERTRERQEKVHETYAERARAAAKQRWVGKQEPSDASSIAEALPDDTKIKIKTKSKAEAKQKPSPDGVGIQDARHSLFRTMLSEYWQAKNPESPEMPWSGRDAKALSEFLNALPGLQEPQFAAMLGNRARSAVAHGDRVYLWICNLTRYQEEITIYNRPVSAGTNHATRAEINRNAVVDAVDRALELAEAYVDRAGETGAEPATVADPGMPVADGPGPERLALALVGGCYHRLAPRHFAYGQTGTDGSLPYHPAIAGAGGTVRNGIPGGLSG